MVVKFDGQLSANDQMEGILIEQDENDMLRLEFLYYGGGLNAFAASFTEGAAGFKYFQGITNSTPLYMKVKRIGDMWTQSYSSDGGIWTDLNTFTHAMEVNAVSVYAGNGNGAANDVVIDYVFNSASPISPEDATAHAVAVTTVGSGTVNKSPDQTKYACGEQVTLTAVADGGWAFDSWSGALSGSTNPGTITIVDGTQNVTATFINTGGPAYTLTTNIVGSGGVTVDPLKGTYDAGEQVALTALPNSNWQFSGWSGDEVGSDNPLTVTISGNKTITATFEEPNPLVSDDFNSCTLDNSLWTFVDPDGDATMAMSGEGVLLSLPAGTTHDTWGNDASDFSSTVPRIKQNVPNSDFEMVVKFDGELSANDQMEGILVEQDENDMLRLEFLHSGGSMRAFAASFTEGAAGFKYFQGITNSTPLYMKVKRIGDMWTQSYSSDGVAWTDMNSFTHAMTVNAVSVYAGNANAATDVVIDYVFNSTSPIVPEDATAHTVAVTTVGLGTVNKSPDQTKYACGEQVTLAAVADGGWAFDSWSGALSGSTNPGTITIVDGTQTVTATFTES